MMLATPSGESRPATVIMVNLSKNKAIAKVIPKKVPKVLSQALLNKMHAYWRAANYLSVGQIYLQDNALFKQKLKLEHIKPRMLGRWSATPGLTLSMCI